MAASSRHLMAATGLRRPLRSVSSGKSAVDVATWRSANGLAWSPLGELTLASDELDGATCFETIGALNGLPTMTVAGTLLSGPCSEGAVVTAGGSYASLDGAEWTRLPFGDRAFAAGVAMIDDRVVIATDTRTNQADSHRSDLLDQRAPLTAGRIIGA